MQLKTIADIIKDNPVYRDNGEIVDNTENWDLYGWLVLPVQLAASLNEEILITA